MLEQWAGRLSGLWGWWEVAVGEQPWWAREVSLERANAARMYDYFLGGAHHFEVDREHARKVIAARPDAVHAARENRSYLGRVVRWCVAQGIRQFLDLGSGIPTVGNVHEIALAADPGARAVYVDVEPVAVAHAEAILLGQENVEVVHADLGAPESVLSSAAVTRLLDFDEPVAVLGVAVLHFVHSDLAPTVERYRSVMAPGSVLAISHNSTDHDDPELAAAARAAAEAYRGTASEATVRSRDELRALFAGFDLVAPGLVDITDWPVPQPAVAATGLYALVGRR